MAMTLNAYLTAVRDTLDSSLNLIAYPSIEVEKQIKPYAETKENDELLLNPIVITKSEEEKCLIEPTVNSVRISFSLKKSLEVEKLLAHLFERFLSLRANKLEIIRRKPINKDYDFSFLVTEFHLRTMHKYQIINFIIQFMLDIEKEILEMKLAINSQMRIAVSYFMNHMAE